MQKKRRKINTGGDGRCDSPGYLAKYGAYLISDMDASMALEASLLLNPLSRVVHNKKLNGS